MFAPERTYRELLVESAADGVLVALRRPALVALVLATSLAIAATGVLPVRLLLSMFLAWSFAPLVQLLAALAITATAPRREVSLSRAIDLLFAGHAPWSLWLLAFAAGVAWVPSEIVAKAPLYTAPVPILWTAWILRAFCATVLNEPPRAAIVRVAVHQGIVWTIAAAYIVNAISWPRLIPFLPFLQR